MQEKRTVLMFPTRGEQACASPACNMGCDHCHQGPSTTSPRLTIEGLEELLASEYADSVETWKADYSTEEARADALERLNRLLEKTGAGLKQEPGNLDTFLTQAAPIVAVDDRIVSIIILPTRVQFESALAAGPE